MHKARQTSTALSSGEEAWVNTENEARGMGRGGSSRRNTGMKSYDVHAGRDVKREGFHGEMQGWRSRP